MGMAVYCGKQKAGSAFEFPMNVGEKPAHQRREAQ